MPSTSHRAKPKVDGFAKKGFNSDGDAEYPAQA